MGYADAIAYRAEIMSKQDLEVPDKLSYTYIIYELVTFLSDKTMLMIPARGFAGSAGELLGNKTWYNVLL